MRADWVYVGAPEAAALAGVSHNSIERWIASGELVRYRLDGPPTGGRPRNLYRLDNVLALVRRKTVLQTRKTEVDHAETGTAHGAPGPGGRGERDV